MPDTTNLSLQFADKARYFSLKIKGDSPGLGIIAIDKSTGDIQIHEGHKPDGFVSCAMSANMDRKFAIKEGQLYLIYGAQNTEYALGPINDNEEAAQTWVANTNALLTEKRTITIETTFETDQDLDFGTDSIPKPA